MISTILAILLIATLVYAIYAVIKLDDKEVCEQCGECKPTDEMILTGGDVFISEYTCRECLEADKKEQEQNS